VLPVTSPVGRYFQFLARKPLTPARAGRAIAVSTLAVTVICGVVIRLVDPAEFDDVWLGLWWAVQTVTTVGYGDVVPHTTAGRLVGTVLMLAGVSLIPLVTSVAVSILTTKRTQVLYDAQDERLTRMEARLDQLAASLPSAPPSEPAAAPPPREEPS
jgi:voltage-gated potassium channel